MVNKTYHPVPVALQMSGQYKVDAKEGPDWSYTYTVEAYGTRSERRTGKLLVDGKPIGPETKYGMLETPWGIMYWFKGAYAEGWLVEGPLGSKPELAGTPEVLAPLPGNGRWTTHLLHHAYTVEISSAYSKSERRVGTLTERFPPLDDELDGSALKTPWGTCYLCNSAYEQGWLFVGCYDRPLAA